MISAQVWCILGVTFLSKVTYATVGDCIVADIPVQQNFDVAKYMGRWYQQRWVNTVFHPVSSRYINYFHYYVPKMNGISAYMSGRRANDNECFISHGQMSPNTTPGKYMLTNADGTTQPYWIIDTDYTNYAYVYGCHNVSSTGRCYGAMGWVLSRTQDIPQIISNKMTEFRAKSCLPASAFLETAQSSAPCNMPKLYKINPNQNCRVAAIQVQESFHKQKFSGLWYEIRWMTQDNIPMSDVFDNYQQELILENNGKMTVYARARLRKCMYFKGLLNSQRDSAKFAGTLTLGSGGSFPHWIIDTDYENYAIAYGCKKTAGNGECEHAQASLWSRRPTLSLEFERRANSAFQRLCINPGTFLWTPQNNVCPPKKAEVSCPQTNGGGLKKISMPLLFILVTLMHGSI